MYNDICGVHILIHSILRLFLYRRQQIIDICLILMTEGVIFEIHRFEVGVERFIGDYIAIRS